MDVEIDTLVHNGINESRYAAYDVTEGEKPSHETVYNRCADGAHENWIKEYVWGRFERTFLWKRF